MAAPQFMDEAPEHRVRARDARTALLPSNRRSRRPRRGMSRPFVDSPAAASSAVGDVKESPSDPARKGTPHEAPGAPSRVRFDRHRVWALLNRLHMSQNELASLAGTSSGYLSQLMSGTRHPSAPLRRQFMKALGVAHFEDLFILEEVE